MSIPYAPLEVLTERHMCATTPRLATRMRVQHNAPAPYAAVPMQLVPAPGEDCITFYCPVCGFRMENVVCTRPPHLFLKNWNLKLFRKIINLYATIHVFGTLQASNIPLTN